jgi:hypothetical protein
MFNAEAGNNFLGIRSALVIIYSRLHRQPKGLAMISKRAKSILIASATIFVFLAIRNNCPALPVDLGAAGPAYWTVLETGAGTVSQSQSVGSKKRGASSTSSHGGVMGNVGIAQNSRISESGSLRGNLYLGDNASAQFSGTYTNNSPVAGTVYLGSGATVSPNYSFNTVSHNPQPMLDQARLDAVAASAAATRLSPSSSLNQINLKRKSLTLDAGVYNLTNLQLNRATLTLSGSGSFVFNISSVFALKSAQVLLAGGATEANVLFNYTGTRDVALSGRGNGSVLHGIILALNARVNLAAGLVVGEIISGKDISLSSNAMIQNLARVVSVPEGASTFLLSLIALGALIAFRSFVVHSSSRRAGPCR